MSFRGLDPRWLALGLLVVFAVLLFLYRQRPPARRITVPSLALWLALEPQPGRARAWLSRARLLLSLLLALAIGTLLMLSLGDPTHSRASHARNLVLLIDCSASMGAHDVAPSRLAQAKQRAHALVRTLGAQDHAWVVALSDHASTQTTRSSEHTTLQRAIDRLGISTSDADLALGVQLALDLLAPYPGGELVLFSDGALAQAAAARGLLAAQPQITVHVEQIGNQARNVAITELAVRPYLLDHAHREVWLQLHNYGSESEPASLRLFAGDTPLSVEQLTLAAGQDTQRVLSDLPAAAVSLRAQLELTRGLDLLASDDQAELRLPARKQTRVLSVSRGDRYLEAALLLDDTLDVTELLPSAYRSSAGYELVIFDGVLPSEPPHSAALYLGPIADQGAFPLARHGALTRPFFDRVEQAHPLLRELALGDVNIGRAAALTIAPGDLAVASSAASAPLIVEGEREGKPFVVFGFDLRDSDLPLRPAFPLLFLRTIERLRGPDAQFTASTASAPDSAIAPRTSVLATRGVSSDRPVEVERWWPWLCALALLLLCIELLSFHRGWIR